MIVKWHQSMVWHTFKQTLS